MVTVFCLVVLALLVVIQVSHVHLTEGDADHCPLCIAMHSVVPFTVAVAAIIMIRVGTAAPIFAEYFTIIRYWYPTLFTRPPPTVG